jgi:hypothetical protein
VLAESFLTRFITLSDRAVQPRIEHRLPVYVLGTLKTSPPRWGSCARAS